MTTSLAELADVAHELASDVDSGDVVLAGGDGAHMAGVTALARAFGPHRLPRIGLAPGGTVNTVLRNWSPYRGTDPLGYTTALLRAMSSRSAVTMARPTLRIREPDRGDDGTGDKVGFIFGAGLVSRFFEVYERDGARGYAAAATIVAKIFRGSLRLGTEHRALARAVLDPEPCEVHFGTSRAPFDAVSLCAASVVRDLGLHMHLLYRAGTEHDVFHAVATPLGPSLLGPQLPRVLLGQPLVGPRVDTMTDRLALRFGVRGAYVLDGDLFRADEVVVTPGPTLAIAALATPR